MVMMPPGGMRPPGRPPGPPPGPPGPGGPGGGPMQDPRFEAALVLTMPTIQSIMDTLRPEDVQRVLGGGKGPGGPGGPRPGGPPRGAPRGGPGPGPVRPPQAPPGRAAGRAAPKAAAPVRRAPAARGGGRPAPRVAPKPPPRRRLSSGPRCLVTRRSGSSWHSCRYRKNRWVHVGM